jgi:hypothetical protein
MRRADQSADGETRHSSVVALGAEDRRRRCRKHSALRGVGSEALRMKHRQDTGHAAGGTQAWTRMQALPRPDRMLAAGGAAGWALHAVTLLAWRCCARLRWCLGGRDRLSRRRGQGRASKRQAGQRESNQGDDDDQHPQPLPLEEPGTAAQRRRSRKGAFGPMGDHIRDRSARQSAPSRRSCTCTLSLAVRG